ncbi:hypothetical protein TNIN_75581 [Trichonephila inaurata madagascariensis]|uniref:Uncharacterized protein n=1 Tax=Trichonephila inaurata madagascariensis TaxID=2747483 RepID=A0A8X6YY75_9ARAC|nr:hypothetical protein TNIN_75581 [Trichonephila inaurata madagascariensis]
MKSKFFCYVVTNHLEAEKLIQNPKDLTTCQTSSSTTVSRKHQYIQGEVGRKHVCVHGEKVFPLLNEFRVADVLASKTGYQCSKRSNSSALNRHD